MSRRALSRHLQGVSPEVIRRVLRAAQEAGMTFEISDWRFVESASTSVYADVAELWLLDEDAFWMRHHDATPERYFPWRKHIDRLEPPYVQCLGRTTKRQQCRNYLAPAANPHVYDPLIHDYCLRHQDQYKG